MAVGYCSLVNLFITDFICCFIVLSLLVRRRNRVFYCCVLFFLNGVVLCVCFCLQFEKDLLAIFVACCLLFVRLRLCWHFIRDAILFLYKFCLAAPTLSFYNIRIAKNLASISINLSFMFFFSF